MKAKLSLLVVGSIAVFTVGQMIAKSSKPTIETSTSVNQTECSEASNEQIHVEEKEEENHEYICDDNKEKEEKEEVKRIGGEINASSGNTFDITKKEYEDLSSRQTIELLLPDEKLDTKKTSHAEPHEIYDEKMTNDTNELERLRCLVKELTEKEVKLEHKLLEYYGMKEQEFSIMELKKQLKTKVVEIDMMKATINSLEAERKELLEEIETGTSAKKELEVARNKIKGLQRQIQLQAIQTKEHLLQLKEHVSSLQAKEEEAYIRDSEVEKKFKAAKQLQEELAELRRTNIELQHEKRGLLVKLEAAEVKVAALSNMNENEMFAKVREEVNELRHANEDLQKQVEGLQMNRFSEVEELVYLRWVNACLRYELRNFQTPVGKMSARELNTNLSPLSQERAKKLLIEYAGSELEQGDADLYSNFSLTSSPGSEDFDDASIASSTSKYSRKQKIIQKLKIWGRSKDDTSIGNSPKTRTSMSLRRRRTSLSSIQQGPLESLMLRNAGDRVAVTSYGKARQEQNCSPTMAADDSLNSIAASFQLMSRSIQEVQDEKYLEYKHRHKLATEREKQIKEKAKQARVERLGDKSSHLVLPLKLAQIKEKVHVSSDSSVQSAQNKKSDSPMISRITLEHIEKRPPRVPRPPPRPSAKTGNDETFNVSHGAQSRTPPPPPPPPPPGGLSRGARSSDNVHRDPQVDQVYQSLMRREAKNETLKSTSPSSNVADAITNVISDIENRSSFLLAVKVDVESQSDFVQSLATEVRAASFSNIEDVVSFVNWLDEELSFLVDERAVLKHFDWPEGKADALREAAFEYQDLMKLENQVSSYQDDSNVPREKALKAMYSLLEKVEQSVYALLRTRDMAMSKYKEFRIPVNWLMDTGVVGKIKLSSIQLAKKYMKRITTELNALNGYQKEPSREFLLLQGIRFAFRVHQFAGGFDGESMKAFEDLRRRASSHLGEDK